MPDAVYDETGTLLATLAMILITLHTEIIIIIIIIIIMMMFQAAFKYSGNHCKAGNLNSFRLKIRVRIFYISVNLPLYLASSLKVTFFLFVFKYSK